MNEFYGFIYLTINLVNGMMYVGKKKYSGNWKRYLGSGKYFKNALNYYGRENFVRIILDNCKTKQELSDTEKEYILELDAVNDNMFYNLAEGGEGGNCKINYEDACKKVIVNNSIIFNSIKEAAAYIGCSVSEIGAACSKYHEAYGYEVWFVDDIDNYKPLEYFRKIKSDNISKSQLKRKDKQRVVLMPDKKIFNNINECLDFVGGTKKGLSDGLSYHKTGFNYMGYELIWEKNLENYKTPEERKAEASINKSNARKGIKLNIDKAHNAKTIICVEDNIEFISIKKASLYYNIPVNQISNSLIRGTKCHGKTFINKT